MRALLRMSGIAYSKGIHLEPLAMLDVHPAHLYAGCPLHDALLRHEWDRTMPTPPLNLSS